MAKLSTTVGQLLINEALPEDMRDYSRTLDKKGLNNLLAEVAEKHPDKYRDISFQLGKVGHEAAYVTGGNSFGLSAMRRAKTAINRRVQLNRELDKILNDDSISDDERDKRLILASRDIQGKEREEIFEESMAEGNQLAIQLMGAGRGNKMNLASLRGSDGLYADHRDRVIPIPVLRSYSQGLSPAEYWAGTYGARQGVMATKFATRDAGYLCLGKGTLVRMADWSVKPIELIRVGDFVLGSDRRGKTFPVRVSAQFQNGIRELHKFKFRYGKSRTKFIEITATNEHKALAEHLVRRRRRPDPKLQIDINRGEYPLGKFERRPVSWHSLLPPQGYSNKYGKTEKWAGLIGLLIAEGGLTTNHIGISCGDLQLLKSIKSLALSHDFELSKKKSAEYEYTLNDFRKLPAQPAKGGGIATGSFLHRMKERLHELGLLGKLANEKTMPTEVWSWNNRSVRELLRWLFAGDGGVGESNNSTTPTVTLGMTAVSVVRGAQRLLAERFGIYGQLNKHDTKDRPVGMGYDSVANHDIWMLTISDRESVVKFSKLIGFVAGAKQKRLERLLQDLDPADRRDKFLFHFVASELVGPGPTFDIEVDHPDHLFVLANGAIVSNSKQLNQISHRQVITDVDRDGIPDTVIGYPTDIEDNDNEGALLAQDTGGYPRNTVLTPKILADLRRKKTKRILVRSPIVSGSPDGGIYARDAGVREFGSLPVRGENVGLTAAQALSEPISQSQLSAKHTGGVAGESKGVSGFDRINQFIQVPKTFKGGAAHSIKDGKVQSVSEAPAGGHFVMIDNEQHYIGSGYKPTVKPGDTIEAGDVISEGMPNPAMIVKYKGVGEGRRYFVRAFMDAIRDAGMNAHRRNVELLSRGLINHVRLTDEIGDFAPDDIVPYSTLEHSYKPRPDHRSTHPRGAVGQYLEKPYLHYSIGTQVKPSMLKDFDEFGVGQLAVHKDPPPFEPEMIRGQANLHHDPDWQTRMFGSGLKGSVLSAVHRGGTSNEASTSFVPGRARAVDFGRSGGPVQDPKRNLGY